MPNRLGEPDRGQPGDEMIQNYLRQETDKISASFADDIKSLAAWEAKRPEYVEQYYYMLGLSPRPEKTPLHATVTGTSRATAMSSTCFNIEAGRICM